MVSIDGSWADEVNMIYLDNPIGVGFSEGPTKVVNESQVADSFIKFMTSFYKVHPEFTNSPFYITGESYAGHYVPPITLQVLRNNEGKATTKIPLRGVMIGNPYVDAILQRLLVRELDVASGIVGTDW